MKHIAVIILSILLLSFGCKTKQPLAEGTSVLNQGEESKGMTDFSKQTSWLLGYFSVNQLKRAPHCEWYLKGFDEYQPNSDAVNKLTAIGTDSLSIKIVMGTWCPDSRREVPRFMKVLDLWKFPDSKITFIGVDNAKVSPVGEYINLGIERVPTFILYKNNIEAGRIIENPATSLEQDIVNILTRE